MTGAVCVKYYINYPQKSSDVFTVSGCATHNTHRLVASY